MSRRIVALSLTLLPALAVAMAPKGRAAYDFIIKAEPFGPMAAKVLGAQPDPETPVVTQEMVEEESNKIQLCVMTITPDGRTAVGLIDNGVTPPAYITLFDGDVANGLELVLSDIDREFATFRRDGITFTLGLGLGLMETITPDLLAQREAEAEEEAAAEAERKRKSANSLAEQLIAMQLSLPPDVEAPPLPIPIGDAEAFTREFDPNKERAEPETETEALIQAGVDELKASVEAGESPQDYLKRLVESRQKEVERQKTEKQAAQAALDQELATGGLSESDAEYLRRRTNIELMKKGVVPLSPVTDLTDAERAEIDAALSAPIE